MRYRTANRRRSAHVHIPDSTSAASPLPTHWPFVEALSALSSDSDPDWTTMSAALLVLRVVDAWAQAGDVTDEELALRVATIAPVVDAVEDDELRTSLHTLIVAVAQRGDVEPVESRLLVFGRTLEARARWELALDVYSSLLALSRHSTFHAEVEAYIRIAECHRHRAEWELAETAFATAAYVAANGGDHAAALRARCYGASVTAERGNLDEADLQLSAVESESVDMRRVDLLALARHGRAHVAFLRGNVELAARLAFEALEHLPDPRERDRALADVAAAFAELGVRSAARDAQLIISATTQDSYVRWTSLINLMELAAGDRVRPAFEQYRRALVAERLPPRLAGYFHYYSGGGARVFGDTPGARDEYRRALGIATRAGLAPLARDAANALRALDGENTPPDAPPTRDPTPATAGIAGALARMRESVMRNANSDD
jgi:tetratricopeptide (TPR) repeat protein